MNMEQLRDRQFQDFRYFPSVMVNKRLISIPSAEKHFYILAGYRLEMSQGADAAHLAPGYADFLFEFAVGRVQRPGIVGIDVTAGQSHLVGPGIAGSIGLYDGQQKRLAAPVEDQQKNTGRFIPPPFCNC